MRLEVYGFPMGFEWFSDQVLQVLEAVGRYYQGRAVEGGFTRPTKELKKNHPVTRGVNGFHWFFHGFHVVFSWFSLVFDGFLPLGMTQHLQGNFRVRPSRELPL